MSFSRGIVQGIVIALALSALPAISHGQSAIDRQMEAERLRRQQDRARQERLQDYYRQQRERAEQATRERNRAVQEGVDRARREYYGTARGSRGGVDGGTVRSAPLAGSRPRRSNQCRRWRRLCDHGRRRYCRLLARRC